MSGYNQRERRNLKKQEKTEAIFAVETFVHKSTFELFARSPYNPWEENQSPGSLVRESKR